MLTKTEIQKIEKYFGNLFSSQNFAIKESNSKDAPAEVYLAGEFIGVVYKNVDEGETSYDFNMSILSDDLG